MKKKIMKICIVFGLVVALIGIPNIPADYPAYINNLNAIFRSNAEELVEVQAIRWIGDELNGTIENWTLAELNEFLEDSELLDSNSTSLEFIPGSVSADQTFTAMVSYGFIEGDSEDLESYREAYPEYLECNVSTNQTIQVMQQYGFIPQGKTQNNLYNFLKDQYDQHQQTIDDFIEQYGEPDPDPTLIFGHMSGWIVGDIYCYGMLHPKIISMLDTEYGAYIICRRPFFREDVWDNDHFAMLIVIFLGVFAPPIHQFINPLSKVLCGFTYVTYFHHFPLE